MQGKLASPRSSSGGGGFRTGGFSTTAPPSHATTPTTLLVYCAMDGHTLELTVNAQTRVDSLLKALQNLTGTPVSLQLAMHRGSRLDPSKALGYYKLPVPPHDPDEEPLILYNKMYIKPGAPTPPIELMPDIKVAALLSRP
eukprot:gene3243-13265_t